VRASLRINELHHPTGPGSFKKKKKKAWINNFTYCTLPSPHRYSLNLPEQPVIPSEKKFIEKSTNLFIYPEDRAKRERTIPPTSRCYFLAADQTQTPASTVGVTVASSGGIGSLSSGSLSLDFARFVDPTPLTVHPRLPLETVMEIFKKVGPRVVLVEHRGKLSGVVTRKDVLKFQFKVENRENPRDDSAEVGREEKLWGIIVRVSSWLRRKLLRQEAPPAGEMIRESDTQDGLLDVEASSMDLELNERRQL